MKKTIFVIAIIVIAAVGGYFVFRGGESQPVQQPVVETKAPAAEEKTITYTDAGYSPATLTIKKGDAVIFKNNSTRSMWPASAKHPTHNVYPTTGGCVGSTFDACKSVQPGDSWSFQFDIAGSWKYHNHLNPSDFGTVVVE